MSWQGRGSTRRWRAVRADVINDAGGCCQLRLPGCTGRATTVHHKAAWRGDPADVPRHLLAAACTKCNGAIGDPTRHDPPPQRRTAW